MAAEFCRQPTVGGCMHKGFENGMFIKAQAIAITPKLLNQWKDKLEAMTKNINHNEQIFFEMAPGFYGYYDPKLDGKNIPIEISSMADK